VTFAGFRVAVVPAGFLITASCTSWLKLLIEFTVTANVVELFGKTVLSLGSMDNVKSWAVDWVTVIETVTQ